jgi:type II secretory pathway pseudopilin PulG
MRKEGRLPRRRTAESGFAMLMLVFITALMLIAVMAVGPSILTQGQRERETELKWRGKQYTRAIKLYYRKNGRFPSSLDDLVKGNLNVRYLRKAFKEPMNTADGSWRLLYVGAAGQIIGSVKPNRNPFQMGPVTGGPPGTTPAGGQGGAGTAGSGSGSAPAGNPSGQNPGSSGAGAPSSGTSGSDNPSPTIIGGSIIGVASKISKTSIMVYEDGRRYIEWEFIWDPSKDAPVQIGPPVQGQPPRGGGPNPPGNSPSGPPATPPTPPPPPSPM